MIRPWFRQFLLVAGVLCVQATTLALQRTPDKSEVELVVRGCLKGRELSGDEISGHEDLEKETGIVFRLSAKGDVESQVKQHNGHAVEITGLVKKTSLVTPGIKIGGGRVIIGAGPVAGDPTRNPARNPQNRMIPMDVSSIEMVAESCRSDDLVIW
jgi:hypothetical protein